MSMQRPPGDRPGPIGILARIGGIAVAAVVAGLLVGLMITPFVGGMGVVTRDVVKSFESLCGGDFDNPHWRGFVAAAEEVLDDR